MIQPSECLHARLTHMGQCIDCGTQVHPAPPGRKPLLWYYEQARGKAFDNALKDTEAGYGYARGRGWKGPPQDPQKGR